MTSSESSAACACHDGLKPVPLLVPLELTAHHVSASGRAHNCEAQISDTGGTILAQAHALFIAVNPMDLKLVRR